MMVSVFFKSLLLIHLPSVIAENVKCAGGVCPMPATDEDKPDCNLWVGPSPIKEHEEHGFGLGMFTGRAIPRGHPVGTSEIMIPLFDTDIKETHPPLREYIWDGGNMPEIPMHSRHGTMLFIPGIAGIVPCTSKNFNVALQNKGRVNTPRYDVAEDSSGVHRGKDPTAGSFSYHNNVTYVAVRDIVAGEELTVECSDDDFDGGGYMLSNYHTNDDAVSCVDHFVRVDVSTIPGAGRGLFAKERVRKGEVLMSTPVIPIHEKEMDFIDCDEDGNPLDEQRGLKQLMLNYCFGHPRSELLLLPYGPLALYINHRADHKAANVQIRWHSSGNLNSGLKRREQYHHPELLDMPAGTVANTHGKGLMIDIVAIRDIASDEEIFLDYGPDWVQAFTSHVEGFQSSLKDRNYISASDYSGKFDADTTPIRTVREQQDDPYPENLQTVCFYNARTMGKKRGGKDENGEEVFYTSWDGRKKNNCLRPCLIVDRYEHNVEEGMWYTARMLPVDRSVVYNSCKLEADHIVRNVPQEAIRILDRPYTSDMFWDKAFRHPLGVPDGFYPETWMKKKLRRTEPKQDAEEADSFKRRKNSDPVAFS